MQGPHRIGVTRVGFEVNDRVPNLNVAQREPKKGGDRRRRQLTARDSPNPLEHGAHVFSFR